MAYIIASGILFLAVGGHGKQEAPFLHKYRRAIQEYIMSGQESGWQNCDVLSAGTEPHGGDPQIRMGLDSIQSLDMESAFNSSHCLLVSYHVNTNQSLSALLKFGWAAILHVRLALVLQMGPGMNLQMATNTSTFRGPKLIRKSSQNTWWKGWRKLS